jgi:hypothetical protein
LLTTVVAAVVIALGAKFMINQFVDPPDRLAVAASDLQHGRPAIELVDQRKTLILMTAATKSFKIIGTPKVATNPVPLTAGGPSSTGGGSPPTVTAPPPNPGTAEAIGYNMLASFGFKHSQWGCLYNLWMRESGWRWNAWNASGAYGIPQALPGSKMASAGADWQTNPATQIKWGLGYIKQIYGTPCGAWNHELAYGWY